MLAKKKVLETVNKLPDNFSLDELIDRIMLLEKIEKGIQQSQNGEVYSTEYAKKKLNKWL